LDNNSKNGPFDPGTEPYISLATYRRDGRDVRTPAWVAEMESKYYVFTSPNVGKVKRIRLNGKASLAACDIRGKISSD